MNTPPFEKIGHDIMAIEDEIINYRVGKIVFTIADVSEYNEFPVVDVEVLDPDGNDLFSDLAFETLEEAIGTVAKHFAKKETL